MKQKRSAEFKRGYSHGYSAGARWPDYKPPVAPDEMMQRVMDAAQQLRDVADGICARLSPEDEFVRELSPGIDAVDAAFASIGRWVRTPHEEFHVQK